MTSIETTEHRLLSRLGLITFAFLCAPLSASAAVDLLGRTSVTYGWEAATGPVAGYKVYVACAPGEAPTSFEGATATTQPASAREITISQSPGDQCIVRVVGLDLYGFASPAADSELTRFNAPPPPRLDFDDDGSADVMVEDAGTGEALVASGATLESGDDLGSSLTSAGSGANPGWTLVGTGHFDNDVVEDFLWRIEPGEGAQSTTFVSGGSVATASVHVTATEEMGEVLAIRDFDGDQIDDVMFYDTLRGFLTCVFTAPASANVVIDFPSVSPARFDFVASGDFDGDGTDDLLWRKKTTGQTVAWLMHGLDALEMAYSGSVGAGPWVGETAGNFNNTLIDDVLWRNTDTGEARIWYMDEFETPEVVAGVDTKGAKWEVIGTGDVNGDGREDLTWHDVNSDRVEVWFMDEEEPDGHYED